MIIDFHSHILPGIDDGSDSVETSKQIISKELKDNVGTILATPHYYCEEQSIEKFISKRNNAYQQLLTSYSNADSLPKIVLASEVYYTHYLNNVSNIKALCIEGTNYLLLELPYKEITPSIIDGILNLADNNNVNLVIAHIERYLKYTSYKSLVPLLNSGVLGQINCGSLVNKATRKNVFKLIKDGYVHTIGTDVHNTTSRPAYMKEALEILNKKFSPSFTETLMRNSQMILNNVEIEDIY